MKVLLVVGESETVHTTSPIYPKEKTHRIYTYTRHPIYTSKTFNFRSLFSVGFSFEYALYFWVVLLALEKRKTATTTTKTNTERNNMVHIW